MTPAQARFMRFAEELIYTARFDTSLKAMLQNGWSVTRINEEPILSAELNEVQSLLDVEREGAGMVVVDCNKKDGSQERPGGGSGAEPGSRSLIWENVSPWLKTEFRKQLANFVHLLHLDNDLDDAMDAILKTPAGKYKPPKVQEGGRQKFVGVLVDTRVLGESKTRPAIQRPPIDLPSVLKLLSAIRARHGDACHHTLHELDLYMTLAGGA